MACGIVNSSRYMLVCCVCVCVCVFFFFDIVNLCSSGKEIYCLCSKYLFCYNR